LVAHGGESASGQFLNTLTITDIASTWTQCFSLICKSEAAVLAALEDAQKQLPFTILGLDSDNGSEFINHGLLEWCKRNEVTFTRSREYKKNDQAHVEERNGSIVRRLIGYDRYEGDTSWRCLQSLYQQARLYTQTSFSHR
jgi:IS30 family transposase